MSDWLIREPEEADLAPLARLFAAHLDELAGQDRLFAESRNPDFDALEFITRSWAAGVQQFRVAKADRDLIGFIRFSITPEKSSPGIRRQAPRWSWPELLRRAGSLLIRLAGRGPEPTQLSRAQVMGYVADLYVLPDRRRQKAGSQLVQAALQWFQERRVDIVYLQVIELNPAGKQFWQNRGFSAYRHTLIREASG